MSTLLGVIQEIAVKAVAGTNPASMAWGKVTSADPLEIQLDESLLTIGGSSIVLTESVVEKKITIQKHTHEIGNDIAKHTHSATLTISGSAATGGAVSGSAAGKTDPPTGFNAQTTIVDTVLDAVCTEFGVDLPVESDDEKIVITTNRGLEVDDVVLMLRLMGGQKFVVLSRFFKHTDEED